MDTGLEVINEIERRLGRQVSKTIEGPDGDRSETKQIVLLVNRVLKNLTMVEDWPMLNADGTLLTNAPITGTDVRLDLTNGSDVVSVSSHDVSGSGSTQATPFVLAHLSWAVQIGSGTPVYRIAEIVSPTQIKLNRAWIGDSNAPTGASTDTLYSFTLAMDQYALPDDFERPLDDWTDFLSDYGVTALGPVDFKKQRRRMGASLDTGDPQFFTVFGTDPTNTFQLIHFHPFPDQQTMMGYSYTKVHPEIKTDRDLIMFPVAQITIVIEAVMYLANRDYEDDQRMGASLQEFMTQFNTRFAKKSIVSDTKAINPKVFYRARSLRTTAGRGVNIDYGDFFDRYDKGVLP